MGFKVPRIPFTTNPFTIGAGLEQRQCGGRFLPWMSKQRRSLISGAAVLPARPRNSHNVLSKAWAALGHAPGLNPDVAMVIT